MENRQSFKDKDNAGDFSLLPDEIITGPLAKYLSLNDLKNLRTTCRFFAYHPGVNLAIKKRSFKIAANIFNTFMLQNDGVLHVMGLAKLNRPALAYFDPPKRLQLPNQRAITQIITGKTFAIILDDLGNCFAFGDNRGNYTGVNIDSSQSPFLSEPMLIRFPGESQPKIVKVAASESHVIFITHQGKCFGAGSNLHGQAGLPAAQQITINTPHPITLLNHKPIVHAVISSNVNFLQDADGHWHQFGSNKFNFLFKREIAAHHQPAPIAFLNNAHIIDIVVSENALCLLNKMEGWFLGALNVNDNIRWPLTPINGISAKQMPEKNITKIILSSQNSQTPEMGYFQDDTGAWSSCSIVSPLTGYAHYHVYGIHHPMQFPTQKKIIHLIPGSSNHIFYGDEEGNWYGSGRNSYGVLGIGEKNQQVSDILPIDFYSLITNEPVVKVRYI